MTDLQSLFAPSRLDPDQFLSVHLGHHIDEVADWPERPDRMIDGLERQLCCDLVRMRAMAACGDGDLSSAIAETISTVVPLASDLDEVDAAIQACAEWFGLLMEDGTLQKIVDVKQLACDVDLLDQDPRSMDAATRAAWHASVRILERHVAMGEIGIVLGGHEIILTAETSGIDVFVQETPGGEDYLALYKLTYPTDGGDEGDDRGGGEDEPDPETGPRPGTRKLVHT